MKILITLLGIMLFSMAASAQDGQVYEYLTMTHHGHDLKIGYGEGEFETHNIKDERTRDASDHRPLLKRISEFEKKGWSLYSTKFVYPGAGPDMIMYAVMRREK